METQWYRARDEFPVSESATHVLIAADNILARLTLEAVLTKSGYIVDAAATSAEAVSKIEEEQYALVLCDLANGDSERVLKLARSQEYRPATARLKVSPERNERMEALEELWVEPVDMPRLLTQITDLLANRAARRAAA